MSLGCAVLLCLVCLFAFACFFLSSFSHLSLKHVMGDFIFQYMETYFLSRARGVVHDESRKQGRAVCTSDADCD